MSIILNDGKGTYAGRPTDMISAPLTVRIRLTMTLPVSAGVLRGAPEQNIQMTYCTDADLCDSYLVYDLRSQQLSSGSHIPPGECHFMQL